MFPPGRLRRHLSSACYLTKINPNSLKEKSIGSLIPLPVGWAGHLRLRQRHLIHPKDLVWGLAERRGGRSSLTLSGRAVKRQHICFSASGEICFPAIFFKHKQQLYRRICDRNQICASLKRVPTACLRFARVSRTQCENSCHMTRVAALFNIHRFKKSQSGFSRTDSPGLLCSVPALFCLSFLRWRQKSKAAAAAAVRTAQRRQSHWVDRCS